MINTKFEAFKLKKLLKVNGVDFEVTRRKLNEFREYTDDAAEVITTIKGIYHEQSTPISIMTTEGSQFRTEKTPMILCSYEDALDMIQIKDIIHYNGKDYIVQGIVNYMELNIVMDISLEVVDDGGNQI